MIYSFKMSRNDQKRIEPVPCELCGGYYVIGKTADAISMLPKHLKCQCIVNNPTGVIMCNGCKTPKVKYGIRCGFHPDDHSTCIPEQHFRSPIQSRYEQDIYPSEEFWVLAVEEKPPVEPQIDLSMLPQNINECFDHPVWDFSKKCVVCYVREMRGGIACNPSLFGYFNCGCIRACSEHYDAVSSYFEKPEFKGKIVHPDGDNYEVRRCPQCCKNFNSRVDNQNQYCGKECQECRLN
jgi:hypothetical protein